MPKQDRTGTKYEKLLAFSLEALGFTGGAQAGFNYLHPAKGAAIVIPGTFIQPDLVLRKDERVLAVVYSTHWSETRSSKKKFWRTWEEQAQQRVSLGGGFLSVNCVFEAMPVGSAPCLCRNADDLPKDTTRAAAPLYRLKDGTQATVGHLWNHSTLTFLSRRAMSRQLK
jgi:hypothetical protein